MRNRYLTIEDSAELQSAFARYLRTGRQSDYAVARKFNPYHDPHDGRFTFAPGGPRSLSRVIVSDRRNNASGSLERPTKPAKIASANSGKRTGAGTRSDLGALSARYESSAGGDPGRVSTGIGDRGGISYGSYQLASKTGTADAFIASREALRWASEFRGLKAGTEAFNAKWREIAARESAAFQAAQRAYVERALYDGAVQRVARATDYSLDSASDAVRQVTYSTAVQHGPTGGASVTITAIRRTDGKLKRTDPGYQAALIHSIYDRRTEIFLASSRRDEALADRYSRSGDRAMATKLRNQARNEKNVATSRFPQERLDALRLLSR